jgi:hypothetical protein
MSMLLIHVPVSTALRWVSTVGRGNHGTQIESFSPDLVPLYAFLMSSTPFGTVQKDVKETTSPGLTYLRFLISLSFDAISACSAFVFPRACGFLH